MPFTIELTKEEHERFWNKVWKLGCEAGCWLWVAATDPKGYGRVGFRDKVFLPHRISYALHHGSVPDDLFVLHRCDVPSCVRPDHLWLGTNRDNMLDASAKSRCGPQKYPGLYPTGEGHANSKLTAEKVLEMRRLFSDGHDHASLSEKFGVTKANVGYIVRGKAWKHLL
jgi:hypothetical protein